MTHASRAWPLLPCTRVLFEKNKITLVELVKIWDKSTVYICERMKRNGTTSIVFAVSSGRFPNVPVGYCKAVRHDQTFASLGDFRVLNIVDMVGDQVAAKENDLYVMDKAPVMVFK